MIYFSDSQETASRFADSIEEFRRVFRSNNIAFGTPEGFVQFSRSIPKNPQLGEDLAVVAKSIMARETAISLRTILTIMAVASGGPDVARSDRDMSRPIDLLIDFLINVGGCSQISSEHPDSPCFDAVEDGEVNTPPAPVAFAQSANSEGAGAFRPLNQEPDHKSFSPMLSPRLPYEESSAGDSAPGTQSDDHVQTTRNAEQETGESSSFSGLHDPADRLTDSLTRLELNNLQMKHYLDSIDQRIGRMEPRLEQVPALVALQAKPRPKDDHDAKFSAAMGPSFPVMDEHLPNEQPMSAAELPEEPLYSAEHALPLWATPGQPLFSRRISLPILLACFALLAGVVFWSLGRGRARNDKATGPTSLTMPTASYPGPVRDSAPASASAVVHASDHPSQRAAPLPAKAGTATSSAAVGTERGKASAQTPLRSGPSPSLSSPNRAQTGTSPALVAATSGRAAPVSLTPTHESRLNLSNSSGRRVNVSSGVMAGNLIESPMPRYPKLASFTHMQGNVVMQAIISRDGTVESVHVLKGHHLLRSAATDAVRTWRYRPYLINGKPVEVATIISVDFSLSR